MSSKRKTVSSSTEYYNTLRIFPEDTLVIVKHQGVSRGCTGLDKNKKKQ